MTLCDLRACIELFVQMLWMDYLCDGWMDEFAIKV